ncbi:terpenoid synthase [Marasmius fiardii PR-910]|nr:terpenoid synthase [Marasmius fiardii PR-910]
MSVFTYTNMNDLQVKNKTTALSPLAKLIIKHVVHDLLEECDIPLDQLPFDQNLYQECKEILESEIIIATTGYSYHLRPIQIHIAIFTALAVTLDDVFYNNHKVMEGFNEQFVKGLVQNNPILDALAKIVFDTFKYYGHIQSNMVVTSIFDFITSLMVDLEMCKSLNQTAGFAAYWQKISSVQVAYAMFVFPKDIDVGVYIQYLPQMAIYINCMNDILSFYKEELKEDQENLVTLLAKESGITKYKALQNIADDIAEADKIIMNGLAGNQMALECWKNFRRGYVHFHTSLSRYRLDELLEIPFERRFEEKSG